MIRSFADKGTDDIFEGMDSKPARKTCPQEARERARRKLDDINQACHYSDLRTPPSNNLHPLKDDRQGQGAIAINKPYRICFQWDGTDAFQVEITDYH